MSGTVSLSRSAFSRGVGEVLTLKPLRDAASSAMKGGKYTSPGKHDEKADTREVTVVRGARSGWHVKRAG